MSASYDAPVSAISIAAALPLEKLLCKPQSVDVWILRFGLGEKGGDAVLPRRAMIGAADQLEREDWPGSGIHCTCGLEDVKQFARYRDARITCRTVDDVDRLRALASAMQAVLLLDDAALACSCTRLLP